MRFASVFAGSTGRPLRPTARAVNVLSMLLVAWLSSHPAWAERRVALVAGNGAYANAATLPNPVRDAQAIAGRLRQLGFDVESAFDQGKAGMDQALRRFGRKLPGADVALFFYAGHGLQIADRNYLVPVDAKLEQEADVRFETVELRDVIELIQSNARAGIVLLDACRNNPLASRLRGRSRSLGRGLAVVETGTGEMLVVYATSPGMTAEDGDGGNSPFTTALLDHIGTRGIEVQTVIKRVIGSVTKQTGGRQVPWQLSSLMSEIYLAGAPAAAAAGTADESAVEIAFWNSIQGTDRIDDFADYLRIYPKGRFVALAQRRMNQLAARSAAAAPAPPQPAAAPTRVAPPPPEAPKPELAPAIEPRPTGPVTPVGAWLPVRSGTSADLHAVWAGGPANVWAGGNGILLRWNGRSWSKVVEDAKYAGTDQSIGDVLSIWGSADDDVWMTGTLRTLHWNGKRVQRSDAGGREQAVLWGARANDVWMGGSDNLRHFDGSRWSVLNLSSYNRKSVWGSGPNDVWAWWNDHGNHWDGANWTPAVMPRSDDYNYLYVNAMWGSRSNDVWAVGKRSHADKADVVNGWRPVIVHWDGAKWEGGGSFAYFPTLSDGELTAVWGSGAWDVWAVGRIGSSSALGEYRTSGLILHWDGVTWRAVVSAGLPTLTAVSGSGPDQVWAVGEGGTILRYVPPGKKTR